VRSSATHSSQQSRLTAKRKMLIRLAPPLSLTFSPYRMSHRPTMVISIQQPKSLREDFKAMLNGTYEVKSVPTRIAQIDEKLTAGGIANGEVMVIAAPGHMVRS
jgi:hypothetical protein